MGVGHQDVAVAADRQARRLAGLVVGVCHFAQEMAVGGEDLDAGGHVDDIEVIVAVDGHGAGLLQPAVVDPPPPPHRLEPPYAVPVVIAPGQQDETGDQQQAFHGPIMNHSALPAQTGRCHRRGQSHFRATMTAWCQIGTVPGYSIYGRRRWKTRFAASKAGPSCSTSARVL